MISSERNELAAAIAAAKAARKSFVHFYDDVRPGASNHDAFYGINPGKNR
jgi:hypothetical protein